MEERKQQKEVWDREMTELAEQFSKFTELKKPVTYIRNGLGNWYTCMLYPGMEPTNNLSEQVIREHVLMRKIMVLLDRRLVLNITNTSLPSSPRGGYREKMSTMNSKNCSSMSFV